MARTDAKPDDGDMTDTNRTRNQTTARLERSREDRIVAGVAGGLGTYMGANPWLFRFAFIVLAFFGGLGVLLYIAAWLLIPDQGTKEPVISRWLGNLDMSDGGTIFGVLLVAVAGLIILGQVANVSSTLIVALVLFVVGFLLYRGDLTTRKPSSDDPSEGDEMTDDETRADTFTETTEETATAVADPPMYEPPPPAPEVMWEPPPPRESSLLGRITVAFGLIVLASMALLDLAFDQIDIEPVHYVATAVVVLGLGLVVGGFIGRARWLIIIGVVLLPALWFTSFWPQSFSFSAGEVNVKIEEPALVESPYELGFGQMTINMSEMTAEQLAEIGSIDASVGMGELRIRLPEGIGATVNARVGAGAVQGIGNEVSGVGIDITRVTSEGPVVIELNLEVGLGVIKIAGPDGVFSDANVGFVIEGSTP